MYGFGTKILRAYHACDPKNLSVKDTVARALLGRPPFCREGVLHFAWKALAEYSCDVMISTKAAMTQKNKENPWVSGTNTQRGTDPYLSPVGFVGLQRHPAGNYSGTIYARGVPSFGHNEKYREKVEQAIMVREAAKMVCEADEVTPLLPPRRAPRVPASRAFERMPSRAAF